MSRDFTIRTAYTAHLEPHLMGVYANINRGNVRAYDLVPIMENPSGYLRDGQRVPVPAHVVIERVNEKIQKHFWIHQSPNGDLSAAGILRNGRYFLFERVQPSIWNPNPIQSLFVAQRWECIIEEMYPSTYRDYIEDTTPPAGSHITDPVASVEG